MDYMEKIANDPIASAAIADSRRWFESLDRGILGTFAIASEPLIAMQANERLMLVNPDDITATTEARRLIASVLTRSGIPFEMIYAEVYFWWLREPPSAHALDDIAITRELYPEMSLCLERLDKVAANPGMHSFYENGVWDNDFISECIASGVDAALAKELSIT